MLLFKKNFFFECKYYKCRHREFPKMYLISIIYTGKIININVYLLRLINQISIFKNVIQLFFFKKKNNKNIMQIFIIIVIIYILIIIQNV
jgi:hypothetical protein